MKSRKVGTAVIGCGRIADAHLLAIQQVSEMEGIATVDIVPERAEKAAEEFSFRRWYTSVDEVLRDQDVEAVIVLLPHDQHRPVTTQALRAGKHVLVEKPMALDTAEADQMIAAADEVGRNLMVAHVLRFTWAQRRARELLTEGAIGDPLQLIERRLLSVAAAMTGWWSSEKATGGLLWMLDGSHSLDMALWLLDTSAERVYAEFGHRNPAWEGEDYFSATLALANGTFASFHYSWHSRLSVFDTVIVGTEATMEIHGFDELILHSERGEHREVPGEEKNVLENVQAARRTGIDLGTLPTKKQIELEKAFVLQDREFALSILEDREPLASGRDVRKVMQALDAGRTSAHEHRTVAI